VRAIAALAAMTVAGSAQASTIKELGPDALFDGAERVVDAQVIARETRWNATHTGLETHVTLAVDAVRKGPADATVELVVPGGELDGGRQIVVGMPAIDLGERARWFLRDRGDGVLAVYGWAQGKWPERVIGGVATFVRDPIAAEHSRVAAFTTNGMKWPAAKVPVPYLIQNAGSLDISLPDEITAIDAAFATWQAVPCASLTFRNAGMTDLGPAIDDNNVLLFVESNWTYGHEAAAATLLWIVDGMQTADIAMNGDDFTWAIGPPGAAINTNTLDFQAVLTHELGHFSGLNHTERAFDTMYYSWKPWPGQRTLSIDDKLGLCSIYTEHGDECPQAACGSGEQCVTHHDGRLCEGLPDPVGTACNYDRVECDHFCLFTSLDLSTGYCSQFCESNADCPPTHHCDVASAGTMPVKVCFVGPQPPSDAGVDSGCITEAQCPAGQYCQTRTGTCTFECKAATDCGAGRTCNEHGQCLADPDSGGCGCDSSGGPAPMLVLGTFALLFRRRRR
jgi:uncharacterized protein (TIGR03382 family)